jgi:hypothetical protein
MKFKVPRADSRMTISHCDITSLFASYCIVAKKGGISKYRIRVCSLLWCRFSFLNANNRGGRNDGNEEREIVSVIQWRDSRIQRDDVVGM